MEELKETLSAKIQDLIRNRLFVPVSRVSTSPVIIPPDVKETKKRVLSDSKKIVPRKKAKGTNQNDEVLDDNSTFHLSESTINTSGTSDDGVLYRVGFDEVLKRLRHQAVVNVTKQRVGELGGRVVEVILDKSVVSYIL